MNGIPTIAVRDLADDAVVIDVREDEEWAAGRAPAAVHIVLGEFVVRLAELPTDGTIAVICRSGARSGRVVEWLTAQGIDGVNVEGGMQAWAAAGKPMVGEQDSPYVA